MIQRRAFVIAGVGAAAASVARAQATYPRRPVSLIVGFSAAGPTDRIARVIAEPLSRHFNQSFIVENRPGANGAVSALLIKSAQPDGQQLLFSGSGSLVMAPLLNSKIGYRTLTDLTPIARVSSYPYFLVVPASSPFKNVSDLITKAREKANTLSYASAGPGSGNHMATEWFQAASRVELVHVPYGGDSAALPDVIAGRVSHIARGIDVVLADDFQMAVHVQTALAITLGRDLLSQRTGPHTGGPDHGLGVDALTIIQGHAVFVDGYH